VNQVEDGAIGADAQRQNESRARVEQRRTPEYAAGVGDIAQEIFEEPKENKSRLCSWIRAGLPNWRRAAMRASRGSALARRTHPSTLDMEFDLIADVVAAEQSAETELSFLNTSGLHQDGGNGAGDGAPAFGFPLELLPAQGRQPVILGLAIVLCGCPFRFDPAFEFHLVKGWIQRTFFGAKNLLRNHLNSTGNGEAVTRTRE